PQVIVQDPWDEGWLVAVKPENLEHDLKMLMCGRKAQVWYQEKEQMVVQAGIAMLSQSSESLGPTLQDGGEQVAGFADMLSPEQFDRIIESLSGPEEPAA
ncbi:MAG: hypothetical protein WCQ99_17440, partial [Pseudomonadota bacterium]